MSVSLSFSHRIPCFNSKCGDEAWVSSGTGIEHHRKCWSDHAGGWGVCMCVKGGGGGGGGNPAVGGGGGATKLPRQVEGVNVSSPLRSRVKSHQN